MSRPLVLSVRAESEQFRQTHVTIHSGEEFIEVALKASLYECYESIEGENPPAEKKLISNEQASCWGRLLGEALSLPVLEALAERIDRLPQERFLLALELEREPRWLHRLPWELLALPDRFEPIVLTEHVDFYRRCPTGQGEPGGGEDLRLLFAAAVPDGQSDRPLEALDWSREQALMEEAIQDAAFLIPADEGNLDYLKRLAEQCQPHILHLSGHGREDELLLENIAGGEDKVDAIRFEKFLRQLPNQTRLVVLSQCLSAAPSKQRGSPAVFVHFAELAARIRGMAVGMQFPISDRAAALWARGFYRALREGGAQVVVRAIAEARRTIWTEALKERDQYHEASSLTGAEWAIMALYVAGDPFPLRDPSLPEKPPVAVERPPNLSKFNAHRSVTAFVGRRRERRLLRRAVLQENAIGVVLRGLGGTGKSTLAAHLLELLTDRARASGKKYQPVPLTGRITHQKLAEKLLRRRNKKLVTEKKELKEALQEDNLEILEEALLSYFDAVVQKEAYLALVFDDFEANLLPQDAPPGTLPKDLLHPTFDDPAVEKLLRGIVEIAGEARYNPLVLIFTCRYPVPLGHNEPKRWLDLPLGPLGKGEERHLIKRLAGRNSLLYSNITKILEASPAGGHPRAIEVAALTAAHQQARLSAKEKQRFAEVWEWLKEKIPDLPQKLQQIDSQQISRQVRETILADANVCPLLARLSKTARSTLEGLALFMEPPPFDEFFLSGAPFTREACPAILKARKLDATLWENVWEELQQEGLIAPARYDAIRQQDDMYIGVPLWLVPAVVAEQISLPKDDYKSR